MSKTYTLNIKPVSNAQANRISDVLFNVCGGVKVERHLADSFRDTDYRYTLSITCKRAKTKAEIAHLEGVALGVMCCTFA